MLARLRAPFLVALALAWPAAAQDSLYVGHPRLLFGPGDVDSIRAGVTDGAGDDDEAWADIQSWVPTALGLPTSALVSNWEGFHTVGQLGLAGWLDPAGTAAAAKAREVVLWLVRNRVPTNDEFATSLRLETMALGYDLAFAGATPAERAEVRAALRAYLDWMPPRFNFYCQAYNPYCGNHGMTVGAAIGLATIALWDDVSASGRDSLAAARAFGDELVAKCTGDILAADGAYREGVLYAAWILRVGAPYFEARRRFDGVDLAADPRFQRLVEWLCWELAPDGTGRTNNLNDSPWATRPLALHNTVLEWAQMRWASPVARYLHLHVAGSLGHDYGVVADRLSTALWARPGPIVNPGDVLPPSRLFPDRGLYVYRSGWKTGATGDEVAVAFSAGTFKGGHAQEDQGQFTLASHRARWAADCGAVGATPTPTPKQTEAHNLVLVDGQGQHNAGSSIGTDATLVAAVQSPFADCLRAGLGSAYATHSPYNDPGVPFPFSDWSWGYDGGNPLERAERWLVVVKGPRPYVLVADDMRKDGLVHSWDWLLHTSDTNAIDLSTEPARLTSAYGACDVYFAHPRAADLALSWATFAHGGPDPPTRRVVASVQAVEPRWFVGLVPRAAAEPPPVFTAVSDSQATVLAIDWGDRRDAALFDPHGVPVAVGGLVTDGHLALVRSDTTGIRNWLLADGTALESDGVLLAWLGARGSACATGDTVLLSGDVLFDVLAPTETAVVAPTGPVAFVRHGDRLRSPTVDAGAPARRAGLALELLPPHPARSAALRLHVGRAGRVRVRVHDVRGREVATILDARCESGSRTLTWDGNGSDRRPAARGVYWVVAESDAARVTRKIVLAP